MKYIYLVFFVLFMGCNLPNNRIKIGESPEDCFTPNDIIIKFATFKPSILYDEILAFYRENKIELSKADNLIIKKWVSDEVFNPNSDENILEWNLDDDDFCKVRRTIFRNKDGIPLDTVSVKICNSIINEGVTVSGFWLQRTYQGGVLTISCCSKIRKTLDRVGYYSIVKSPTGLEYGISGDKLKHMGVTEVYFHYQYDWTEITKKIFTDETFLYSELMNLDDRFYLK